MIHLRQLIINKQILTEACTEERGVAQLTDRREAEALRAGCPGSVGQDTEKAL